MLTKRPQIVYLQIAQNTLGFLRDCLFLVPAKVFRKKLVVHLHGGYFQHFYQQSNALMKALIRWTLKGVSQAIVLGERLRPIFEGMVPRGRIAVVPNGIEGGIFEKATQASSQQANKCRQILFLSTLVKTKGFMDVLQAAPLVIAHRKDVKFVFAGELCYEEERREAMDFIATEDLGSYVEFPGVVVGEEKARLLASSDVFVFPTYYLYEGHPFVIIEAMAAGLPIITTDQGCICETIVDGENGFIVPKRNPAAIAKRILFLLQDDDLRRQMAQANRERFSKLYTLERWADKMAQIFEAVASEPSS
jgi:glycosyltransferase involved in cell wall biosynthesis